MGKKVERLCKQVTGINPNDLQPKPDMAIIQKWIRRQKDGTTASLLEELDKEIKGKTPYGYRLSSVKSVGKELLITADQLREDGSVYKALLFEFPEDGPDGLVSRLNRIHQDEWYFTEYYPDFDQLTPKELIEAGWTLID